MKKIDKFINLVSNNNYLSSKDGAISAIGDISIDTRGVRKYVAVETTTGCDNVVSVYDDMMVPVFRKVLEKTKVAPREACPDDIIVGPSYCGIIESVSLEEDRIYFRKHFGGPLYYVGIIMFSRSFEVFRYDASDLIHQFNGWLEIPTLSAAVYFLYPWSKQDEVTELERDATNYDDLLHLCYLANPTDYNTLIGTIIQMFIPICKIQVVRESGVLLVTRKRKTYEVTACRMRRATTAYAPEQLADFIADDAAANDFIKYIYEQKGYLS